MKIKNQKPPVVRLDKFNALTKEVQQNRLLILTLIKELEKAGVLKTETPNKIELATPEQTKRIIKNKEK